MNTFTKIGAAVVLATAAMSASANLPFTFTSAPDTSPAMTPYLQEFVATEINASYQEGISVNAAGTQFSAAIFVDFSTFAQPSGSFPASVTGLGIHYGLYALINVVGDISSDGAGNFDLFNFSGDMDIFADWDNDSGQQPSFLRVPDFSVDGAGIVSASLVNTADDVLLATTTSLFGSNTGGPLTPSASFALGSDTFALTAAGEDVFLAPRPFHMRLSSTGDTSSLFTEVDFTGAVGGLQTFGDTASIRFVPEPTSVAFLGLGLFGLAFAARRKA